MEVETKVGMDTWVDVSRSGMSRVGSSYSVPGQDHIKAQCCQTRYFVFLGTEEDDDDLLWYRRVPFKQSMGHPHS